VRVDYLRTGALSNVGWTRGEILEVQLRLSILSLCLQFTPERTPHARACAC
jgi:hypothetical protein